MTGEALRARAGLSAPSVNGGLGMGDRNGGRTGVVVAARQTDLFLVDVSQYDEV